MEIAGSVTVLTGAGGGFGRSFAEALVIRGGSVFLTDVNQNSLKATVQHLSTTLTSSDKQIAFEVQDVTEGRESFQKMFDLAEQAFGRKVNILINNAGISGLPDFLTSGSANWQRVIDINLTSLIAGTQVAIERMQNNEKKANEQIRGVIINVASAAGLYPAPMVPVYSATKTGVVGFSRSLGYLAKGDEAIVVSTLCPFFADTPMGRSVQKHPVMQAGLQQLGGLIPVEKVTKGLLMLIQDNKKGGAALKVSNKGIKYHSFYVARSKM